MSLPPHHQLPLGQGHIPEAWQYADATARAAATGFTADDVGRWARQLDDNSLWVLTDDSPVTWAQIGGSSGGGGAVSSVNGQTGVVALTSDDVTEGTTNLYATAAELAKLAGIEAGADVTDAGNVAAAGAVMVGDTVKIGPSAAFDGGGAALTTAVASPIVRVPYATTITGDSLSADQIGSAVVDVQRATSAAPTTFTSIAGTAKPTLSGAQSATDTTLTGWGDTTLDEGDFLRFVLDSVSGGIEWLGVFLHAERAL